MELRHIRYFLAVAEEGNFTRAAARVGIGQPPLSQQIRDLEAEVGAPLFRRLAHGAELTEAGRAFQSAVAGMPGLAAEGIRRAQRAARGETGVLRIGFTGAATLNPLVPRAIRTFRRRFPDVDVSLVEDHSTALTIGLREGSIDVAFLRPGPGSAIDIDMLGRPLPDEPMVAALPSGHAILAGETGAAVKLYDLRDDMFMFTPRAVGPTLFDAAVEACAQAGFTPKLGQTAPQLVSVLALVAAEEGISIVPASMRQLALDGVIYRDIADANPVARLALVHLRSSRSATIQNFIVLARQE